MKIPQKFNASSTKDTTFSLPIISVKAGACFLRTYGALRVLPLNLMIQLVAGVVPVIGFIASLLITVPLNIGFFIVCWHIEARKFHEFQTFFKGFEFIGPLAAQYAIQMLASIALILPIIGFVFMDWNILEDDLPSIQPWKFALLLP